MIANLRPADLFAIVVPLGLGIASLLGSRRIPEGLSVGLLLVAVSAFGFLARVIATQVRHPAARVLGDFYCIATIWFAYSRLNPVIDLVSPVTYDRELQAIDEFLFGVQPSVYLSRFHMPMLTELAYYAYVLFFFWQLSLGILLYRRPDKKDFEDYYLTVIAFYMLSYIGYVMIPAIGPRFDVAHQYPIELTGVFRGTQIRDSFYNIPMVRDCFPSGHTGLTLLVLTRALTKRAFGFFLVMLPCAMLLIFSTVYCRFHYVADLLCALPFITGILCVDEASRRLLPNGLSIRWLELRASERVETTA
ncbi:MAG: phosphatase PAP2 family protein [Deltaproteobacteria bacterium]|nr:phosphatase PAP2 family protein [Deltaproteobacteria bacterium]